MQFYKIALFFILTLLKYSYCMQNPPKYQTNKINLAAELLETAEKAGLNFTITDLDIAESAANNEEIVEVFPLPVAQKLIGHRNRNEMDAVREQMIGMIFTGEPISLGSFITPTRRAFRTRPKKRPLHIQTHFDEHDTAHPTEILKPLPFLPAVSSIKFPSPRMSPDAIPRVPLSNRPRNGRPRRPMSKPVRNRAYPRPHDVRPTSHFSSGNRIRPAIEEDVYQDGFFSNTVGSDFGPVTYETFGAEEQEPDHFEPHGIPNKGQPHRIPNKGQPHRIPNKGRPHRIPNKGQPHQELSILSAFTPSEQLPASGFTTTKFGFNKKPNDISHRPSLGTNVGSSFGTSFSHAGGCTQYTEEICLDTDVYPHEAILSSLIDNPDRADNLMAEVTDQSADNLVDGLTAAQESKYDYSHYFGNRRQDSPKQSQRDFANDGGYLCPSEVKYARPKRARNSKGDWKFIVNMDKYTQTIRMEKCMKPGGTCSYISHHYYAMCNQIYNYQRLLSWEKHKGLHMDIYKVPSCCSCHIQGYAYIFPPLHGRKDGDFASSRKMEEVVKPPPRKAEKNIKSVYPINSNTKSDREPIKTSKRRPGRIPTRRRTGGATKREKPRRRFDQGPPIKRQGNPSRINYGYHPIIDFFKQ